MADILPNSGETLISGGAPAERKEPGEPTAAPDVQPEQISSLAPPSSPAPAQPKIVDKSTEAAQPRPVAPGADTITSLADRTEGDFIEKVEAAHQK